MRVENSITKFNQALVFKNGFTSARIPIDV